MNFNIITRQAARAGNLEGESVHDGADRVGPGWGQIINIESTRAQGREADESRAATEVRWFK